MVYNEELDKDIPVGWETKPINCFGTVVTGKTPSGKNPHDFGEIYPFVTPGDFNYESKYIQYTRRYLSKNGFEKLKNKALNNGDVIVTCIGSDMGKVALAIEGSITNQQLNSIKVDNIEYSDYLFAYFKEFKDELKSIAMGSSTMPMINKTDFELIQILKPNLSLLKLYFESLLPINEILKKNLTLTQTLQELQSLLLAKMTKVEALATENV